jgi:hypothetical protein
MDECMELAVHQPDNVYRYVVGSELRASWDRLSQTEKLQNSAIEVALDQIHPERHEAIGRSKDLAAAAVVWAGVFGLICFVLVVTHQV